MPKFASANKVADPKMTGLVRDSSEDKIKLKFVIELSRDEDITEIVSLINNESARSGGVAKVTEAEIRDRQENGRSLVAKTEDNEIIGYFSAYLWPESGWLELKSSVVKEEFRNHNIASYLVFEMSGIVDRHYPKNTLVAFTNSASSGSDIILAYGFIKIPYEDVPKELFTKGNKNRGKEEFGYTIFAREPLHKPE